MSIVKTATQIIISLFLLKPLSNIFTLILCNNTYKTMLYENIIDIMDNIFEQLQFLIFICSILCSFALCLYFFVHLYTIKLQRE